MGLTVKCVYDPVLSVSKSQGNTPLYKEYKDAGKSEDPRLKFKRNIGKRQITGSELEYPKFALNQAASSKKILFYDINEFKTRNQLLESLKQYAEVEVCNLVTSSITGVSLGILSVVFKNLNLKILNSIELACDNNSLFDCPGVRMISDPYDDHLRFHQRRKEMQITLKSNPVDQNTQSKVYGKELGFNSFVDSGLKMIEYRDLSLEETNAWYNQYLDKYGTYIYISKRMNHFKVYDFQLLEPLFRSYKYTNVMMCHNTGIYITFDDLLSAFKGYLELQRAIVRGFQLHLRLTVRGQKVKGKEAAAKYNELRGKLDREKTLRPPRVPPQTAQQTARQPTANIDFRLVTRKLMPDIQEKIIHEFQKKLVDEIIEQKVINLVKDESFMTAIRNGSYESDTDQLTENGDNFVLGKRDNNKQGLTEDGIGDHGVLTSTSVSKIRKQNLINVEPQDYMPNESKMDVDQENSDLNELTDMHSDVHSDVHKEVYTDDDKSPFSEPKVEPKVEATKGATQGATSSPTLGATSELKVEPIGELNREPSGKPDSTTFVKSERPSSEASGSVDLLGKHKIEIELDRFKQLKPNNLENSEYFCGFDGLPTETREFDLQTSSLRYPEVQNICRSQKDFERIMAILDKIDTSEVKNVFKTFMTTYIPTLETEQNAYDKHCKDTHFRIAKCNPIDEDLRRSYLPVDNGEIPRAVVTGYTSRKIFEHTVDEVDDSKQKSRMNQRRRKGIPYISSDRPIESSRVVHKTKNLRLARSGIHDWGLYAEEDINPGQFIIEYVGEVIEDDYADYRELNYMMEGIDSTYLFRLDQDTIIDATKRGNAARLINHSCDPNCVARYINVGGTKRIALYAAKHISRYEELTFDYKFVKAENEADRVRCRCGSANCRIWLM